MEVKREEDPLQSFEEGEATETKLLKDLIGELSIMNGTKKEKKNGRLS